MESSSGIEASLGGRYATALFDLARESGSIDTVAASLATLGQALHDNAELNRLVTSPLVGRAEAIRAVTGVADAMALDGVTRSFLGVLAQNRRVGQLVPILRAFRLLTARHRGETTAEVTSAHPLAADQVDALRQQLRHRLGRDVNVEMAVDPALLGGLVVRIGSQMIDSSIRTRLNNLAQAMKG